ncbi:MAG: hypothetical protein EON58_20430, partial [Alphaproteobacteria bacterium]
MPQTLAKLGQDSTDGPIGGALVLGKVRKLQLSARGRDELDVPGGYGSSLLNSSEIGPEGEVIFTREAVADQRFLEPYSGLYYQVSAKGQDDLLSRSLWDRKLAFGSTHDDRTAHFYDSAQFPDEKLR